MPLAIGIGAGLSKLPQLASLSPDPDAALVNLDLMIGDDLILMSGDFLRLMSDPE